MRKIVLQLLLTISMLKKKKTRPLYVSKRNSNYEKQVLLLMVPSGEGWDYIV